MNRSRAVAPDGVEFRDLNGNGELDPYEDPRLSPEERVADLVPRLSLEEKAGLLFHSMIGVGEPGAHDEPAGFSPSTPRELVIGKLLSHFNVSALPSVRDTVRWHNALQELAEETPHGIPITLSTDPRHAFSENAGASIAAGDLSQWPEPLGLAAIGDIDLVRRFADIARQEYVALGIRAALHPQVDLATEPRWARQMQTFGQDAATASAFVNAYLEGFQGPRVGPGSVACTTKHFPGGGPLKDGGDSHFVYGHDQVYPGGRFEEHLAPFRAAIAAGTSAMMPAYGKPIDLELDGEPIEEVAFSFNRRIITRLLREELGFDGVIVTDWGLITDVEIMGLPFPARAWGVEDLTPLDRMERIFEAGADQFGGEERTDLVLDLVTSGRVPESRIDEAVRRLLLVKFELGLFDDPYLDEDEAERIVGSAQFREAGHRAQGESVTVLKNGALPDGAPVLPLRPGLRVYLEGVASEAVGDWGTVVSDPAGADVALVRLAAPFEPRNDYFLEAMFHQGSLDFPAEVVDHVRSLAAVVPVVVDVTLDRPAILADIDEAATGLVATYGASDAALLEALSGRIAPRGRLPFELPRSMVAVEASRPDVPSDTVDPLYRYGHGLTL
ncbi:glycoside hydrolase family 3 N-terminal domain-containing protein [Naasia sp. SYSU D00057]|uniref:glycoside hydrolase family 3 protein n=1 Tax=Naasia sp. SYSU D00057 TaxID=2817380 RepID=UPI001B307513|nr:glycoside hydrolase family 3 N-terminal domain-containing protein [Naasia sp. SYSU D00057]